MIRRWLAKLFGWCARVLHEDELQLKTQLARPSALFAVVNGARVECKPLRVAGLHVICRAVTNTGPTTIALHASQCEDQAAFWAVWSAMSPQLFLEDGTRWQP